MTTPYLRTIFVAAIAAVAASATLPARASTFTVGGTTNKFIVTRSGEGIDSAETVRYRTVGLSAYASQHFTSKSGSLTFAAGQTAITNFITETSPSAAAYKFQTGSNRSYRFELTDEGGFPITNKVRTIATGTRSSILSAQATPSRAGREPASMNRRTK